MSDYLSEDEIHAQSTDAVSYDPTYTVDVNEKRYGLNQSARERIQRRAEYEYSENERFSCWWKVASERDAQESDLHEEGDPILVIETEGYAVPWEKIDQLELEMQDTDAFQDVDSGGGMQTVKPDEMGDDEKEKERTHFGVTPQDFEELPSPDGESSDKVPAMPETLDEPTMVMWVPDDPEVEHTWSAGTAMTPMVNWVEWNVQAKANQPRMLKEKPDSHDHWESILKSDNCRVVAERTPSQKPQDSDSTDSKSGSAKRKGEDQFEDGKFGGNNWQI